jgi:hypothetical protein
MPISAQPVPIIMRFVRVSDRQLLCRGRPHDYRPVASSGGLCRLIINASIGTAAQLDWL